MRVDSSVDAHRKMSGARADLERSGPAVMEDDAGCAALLVEFDVPDDRSSPAQ